MVAMRIRRALILILIASFVVFGTVGKSLGQSNERVPTTVEPVTDVDVAVQLHLLVASKSADSGKLPAMLEAVVRDLQPSLPFTNYRLGASYLSRVKNGRPLNVKGIGRSLLVLPLLDSPELPSFYEISAGMLNLKKDSGGRAVVHVTGFRFGLRIPLQMLSGPTKEGGGSSPYISYESVGITTEMTVREGEAVVVGTLDAGRPNETLVLVLVVRRVSVD